MFSLSLLVLHFFFNDTPTTDIYTLSLHVALPISLPSYQSTMHSHSITHSHYPPLTIMHSHYPALSLSCTLTIMHSNYPSIIHSHSITHFHYPPLTLLRLSLSPPPLSITASSPFLQSDHRLTIASIPLLPTARAFAVLPLLSTMQQQMPSHSTTALVLRDSVSKSRQRGRCPRSAVCSRTLPSRTRTPVTRESR